MTQKETRQQTTDKSESNVVSTDFENLLLRSKAKEAIEESEWSEVVVDDVQVYSGYEFADASVARDQRSVTPIRGTISGSRSPKEVLEDMDEQERSEYTTETSKFKHADGTIVHNGRKVLYRRRKWIVVEARSPDGTYSEQFVVTRTPKFENSNLEEVYKSIVQKIESSGSIGSPPDSSKTYLRTDQVLDSSKADMLVQSALRFGIMGTSVFAGTVGAVAVTAATGSFFAGTLFLGTVIMMASMMQQRIYDGWFELVSIDWIDDIPDGAKITASVTEDMDTTGIDNNLDLMSSEAEVQSYSDGDVVISTPSGTWTFESDSDGVPSDAILNMYKDYGGIDFAEQDSIPVKVAEYDERIPLRDDQYLSDDGKWVLESDGL